MPDRRRLLFLLAAVGLGAAGATLFAAGEDIPAGQPATPPYLTIFLIDGLSEAVFQEELAAGRLPGFRRMMGEGLYVPHGIAAFPTMTGYGFYPLLTGEDATRSGVLGLRWFDASRSEGNFRNYVGPTNRAMNGDLAAAPPTLFECFPSQHSLAVNSYLNRGVHRTGNGGWRYTMAKYHDRHWLPQFLASVPWIGSQLAPDWAEAESAVVGLAIADLPNRPKVQWITLSSPDAHSHLFGSDDGYRALVRQADGLVTRYREASEALGQEPDRIYLVASDHGVVDVHTNLDLRQPLEGLGLRTWRGNATYFRMAELNRPRSFWAEEDVIEAINGNTMAYLYLVSEPARARRAEIADALRKTAGVALVVQKGPDGSAIVDGPSGRGIVAGHADAPTYRLVSGEDPMGYCDTDGPGEWCDGTPHSPAEWLTATHGGSYPYAVPRLHALMTRPDAGDFVVTAAAGFDLAKDYELVVNNYRGGHGGLRADQIRVPYLLAGPGVPPGERIETLRAEDVGRRLAGLLGCPAATP